MRSSGSTFFPENPIRICDKLCLMTHERKDGNDSKNLNEELVAKTDKVLDYKCNTTSQHKKFYSILN